MCYGQDSHFKVDWPVPILYRFLDVNKYIKNMGIAEIIRSSDTVTNDCVPYHCATRRKVWFQKYFFKNKNNKSQFVINSNTF